TTPTIRGARSSAGWALLFIAILYTTAPAVAAFARLNLINTLHGKSYAEAPSWFRNWEKTGLVAWKDRNGDGKIHFAKGEPFKGKLEFEKDAEGVVRLGAHGERVVSSAFNEKSENELYVDRDIMVLANPEIARLPAWVVALVAAGGLAAALSTAAGLLLVIASAISHDLIKNVVAKDTTEKAELLWARGAAGVAVIIAGYFGINPPGFVAQVVAFAFGLAASSFFPVIILGIFWKRASKEGAIAGMLSGMLFTAAYIVYFKFVNPSINDADHWFLGISPEGIGSVGMVVNFVVAWGVSLVTKAPPEHVQEMVAGLRYPRTVE
ncbi:MAG: VC_2705 family sodium/solute symporter, partial [Thermoanaerobaculia bacterium]|nr:VC_2705 family sodium/solute symporter [Thermoanaerobaculia bacterium]